MTREQIKGRIVGLLRKDLEVVLRDELPNLAVNYTGVNLESSKPELGSTSTITFSIGTPGRSGGWAGVIEHGWVIIGFTLVQYIPDANPVDEVAVGVADTVLRIIRSTCARWGAGRRHEVCAGTIWYDRTDVTVSARTVPDAGQFVTVGNVVFGATFDVPATDVLYDETNDEPLLDELNGSVLRG